MWRKAILTWAVLQLASSVVRAQPPAKPNEQTHIVTLLTGPNRVGDGESPWQANFVVRTSDGAGVENAEVTVSLVSAPRPKPYRTNKSGEVIVNVRGAHAIDIRAEGVTLVSQFGKLGWPANVIIGPEKAAPASTGPKNPNARAEGMKVLLSVRGGSIKTPDGTSEQRVRVLNRNGKGIEGVAITARYDNRPYSPTRTERTDWMGDAIIRLKGGEHLSLGVYAESDKIENAIWLESNAIRWPLEVKFEVDITKAP